MIDSSILSCVDYRQPDSKKMEEIDNSQRLISGAVALDQRDALFNLAANLLFAP